MTGILPKKKRIESMFSFIQSADQDRATLNEIKSFMLKNFGLKFETTTKYVKECSLAGFLIEQQGRWEVTRRWEQLKKMCV